jgi:hypothetical protein
MGADLNDEYRVKPAAFFFAVTFRVLVGEADHVDWSARSTSSKTAIAKRRSVLVHEGVLVSISGTSAHTSINAPFKTSFWGLQQRKRCPRRPVS